MGALIQVNFGAEATLKHDAGTGSVGTVTMITNGAQSRPTADASSREIDLRSLKKNARKLQAGLIAPAERIEREVVVEHDAEPIKDMADILRIREYLIQSKRWRDNMLFICGINFGLRVSDLRLLRFCDLIDESMNFKESLVLIEQKTSNTRRVKRNRHLSINNAVIEAVTLYLENVHGVKLSDYLFRCESNRGKNSGKPIHRNSIDEILKGIARDLGLTMRVSTHTLRKTFGYHQMVMGGNDHRTLLLLQKMFGHSSAGQTLEYIGITRDEIEIAYRRLNLGSVSENYLVDSALYEQEITTA